MYARKAEPRPRYRRRFELVNGWKNLRGTGRGNEPTRCATFTAPSIFFPFFLHPVVTTAPVFIQIHATRVFRVTWTFRLEQHSPHGFEFEKRDEESRFAVRVEADRAIFSSRDAPELAMLLAVVESIRKSSVKFFAKISRYRAKESSFPA